MTKEWAITQALLSVAVGGFGPICLKKGAHIVSPLFPSTFFNRWLILGVFLHAASTAIYIPTLRVAELSLIYPLVSLNFAVVAGLSVYFLKESMNRAKWFGIALIIVGASVVSAF